jgi:hypothetical protein
VGSIDWGNAPAWASVVVALIAVLFAGLGARAAIRGNRNQQKQLEFQQKQIEYQQMQLDRLEDDKRREQASKVCAYKKFVPEPPDQTGYIAYKQFIRVANNSDLPVFLVVLQPVRGDESALGDTLGLNVLPPGVTDIIFKDPDFTYLSLTFGDCSGGCWNRTIDGALVQVSRDELHSVFQGAEQVEESRYFIHR